MYHLLSKRGSFTKYIYVLPVWFSIQPPYPSHCFYLLLSGYRISPSPPLGHRGLLCSIDKPSSLALCTLHPSCSWVFRQHAWCWYSCKQTTYLWSLFWEDRSLALCMMTKKTRPICLVLSQFSMSRC